MCPLNSRVLFPNNTGTGRALSLLYYNYTAPYTAVYENGGPGSRLVRGASSRVAPGLRLGRSSRRRRQTRPPTCAWEQSTRESACGQIPLPNVCPRASDVGQRGKVVLIGSTGGLCVRLWGGCASASEGGCASTPGGLCVRPPGGLCVCLWFLSN